MNGQARAGVQLLVTHMTLEMLGLLMLYENLLIVKLSVAVPVMIWLRKSKTKSVIIASILMYTNNHLQKIFTLFTDLFFSRFFGGKK